jgi:hypothetical protein
MSADPSQQGGEVTDIKDFDDSTLNEFDTIQEGFLGNLTAEQQKVSFSFSSSFSR